MTRAFPWKCRTCGERKVNPATVLNYSAEMEHDGRAYSIVVPQLELLECESCKTRVLTDDAHKALTYALRKAVGLLLPEQIRFWRERFNLSQKQLATLLKVAESTISRWETGGQIQQRPMDLLLRLFFDVPAARMYLMSLGTLYMPIGIQDVPNQIPPETAAPAAT